MNRLIIVLVLFSLNVSGQAINQDADGYSTIILPSANFNLDIAEKNANFNVNGYLTKVGVTPKPSKSAWFIGGNISAKVENKLGSIFSGGNLASGAAVNGLIGWRLPYEHTLNQNKLVKLQSEKDNYQKLLMAQINEYERILNELRAVNQINDLIYENVRFMLSEDSTEIANTLVYLDSLASLPKDKRPAGFDPAAVPVIRSFISPQLMELKHRDKKLSEVINSFNKKYYSFAYHKVFLRGGINGNQFKYDLGQDSTTVESRFRKRNFNGWQGELVYNLQYKAKHFIGIGLEWKEMNNLSDLEEQEFTLTTIDTTITDGKFSSSTTVEAFAGKYDVFLRQSINFDYVYIAPLRDQDGTPGNIYLAPTLYFRYRTYQDRNSINENMVLGIGINAFNSQKQSVAGGIAVQANDVFGTNTDKDFGQRLSISIVARFSFSGLKPEKKSD